VTTERYLLPDRRFMNDLSVTFCSQVNLLGASPRKSAAQFSFAISAVLQQLGLARRAWRWRGRGQGTGQAGVVDDFVLFGRSMGLSQAAVELQVSFALLL